MNKMRILLLLLLAGSLPAGATERFPTPDLPSPDQVETALDSHINVVNAHTGVLIEQVNQDKWESGSYEFNLRAGSSRRQITGLEHALQEWDVALERPIRLPNKVWADYHIGAEGVARAHFALGDARHEAGRSLLHLWFNWQREQAQATQWQQQVVNLTQQAAATEKRFKAGDAPRMEVGQALAAVAQANVSLQQAQLRTDLARNELIRQFPQLLFPPSVPTPAPQPIEGDLAHWEKTIMEDNHELGMVEAEQRQLHLIARRTSADRLPDPTLGIRYSNEMGGREKVAGLYLTLPISFGQRGDNARHAEYVAQQAADRAEAVRRRLKTDIYAAYTQAINSYQIWQQAKEAAHNIGTNANLIARAYALGESSLNENLSAARMALESALSESLARLDANEARYRLLLDAHQLWPAEPNATQHGESE